MKASEFTAEYIDSLKKLLDEVDPEVIQQIADLIDEANERKTGVYIIGNGGSASTASHMANDLKSGLKRRNILDVNIQSLADNIAITTALANDIGFENIFYEQLRNVISRGDVLIAISASGNSPNILKAVEYAISIGAKIIGCTGFDGGRLFELSDVRFHVNTEIGEYGLVEDIHMILDHLLYTFFVKRG